MHPSILENHEIGRVTTTLSCYSNIFGQEVAIWKVFVHGVQPAGFWRETRDSEGVEQVPYTQVGGASF